MAEYIKRETAIEKTEAFCDVFVTQWTDEKVIAWIRKLPAADVVEVVHGRNLNDTPSLFECSVCHWECWDTIPGDTDTYNYCPNCGARMDGE